MKTIVPKLARLNAALFGIETRDEIVVDVNQGGRTTFKNAGRTERRGLELGAQSVTPGRSPRSSPTPISMRRSRRVSRAPCRAVR